MLLTDKRKKYHVTENIHTHEGKWCILYGFICLICKHEQRPANDWRRSAVYLARQHVKKNHGNRT